MAKSKAVVDTSPITESDEVFELAAELFRVMSAPMRLRIISSLCNGEKNVGELLREIDTTQPNMSQHLLHVEEALGHHIVVGLNVQHAGHIFLK